jgi:molecular chaperone DnaJ
MRKNKSLNIKVQITLEDVLKGKDINAEIGIPGSRNKIINIKIPAGIEHGQQIRYEGMGDMSIPDLRAGDLIVNVFVEKHPTFFREGSSLICEHELSIWDAVLGKDLEIKTLDSKTLTISVPAGTQPETILSCRNEGLPDMRTKSRGNLLIKFKIAVPKNLSAEQIQKIREIKNGF